LFRLFQSMQKNPVHAQLQTGTGNSGCSIPYAPGALSVEGSASLPGLEDPSALGSRSSSPGASLPTLPASESPAVRALDAGGSFGKPGWCVVEKLMQSLDPSLRRQTVQKGLSQRIEC
jgi:hypothetical protein